MSTELISQSGDEPVTLEEVKEHLRVDCADDDAYIHGLIKAARELAENYTRRDLIPKTWDWYQDCFPRDRVIEPPKPPLRAVQSVIYWDTSGLEQTMQPDDYQVDVRSVPGRLALRSSSASWPATDRQMMNAVVVRLDTGHASVPETVKQALLIMIADWYEFRESGMGHSLKPDSKAAALLNSHKIWGF